MCIGLTIHTYSITKPYINTCIYRNQIIRLCAYIAATKVLTDFVSIFTTMAE